MEVAMTELSTYALESLREDAEVVLYRARREADPRHILVVAPLSKHPAQGAFRRLENEYSLRTRLDPAWAVLPLALVREKGRTMLVLEDPGGQPLNVLLERPLDLTEFLRISIALANALGRLHEHGIIHKDIKPAHVMVHPTSGQVWLTGFGIASDLPRERQAPVPPETIAGTLAYMAPEQTGRMNRSIDSRSDLYSLGIMLYEMLTGVLPFSASDPIEWVHCHIARQPMPPAERRKEVPKALSAIVLKLLAKTAEERYQTAAGLEADLRRCLADWESLGRIDPFLPGVHDASDRLLIPEKLYGRDRESKALFEAFDRIVARGTPELVLVSGYSGVGKSSVVNELHKAIVLPRGIFISGKFDQYKRDIPYATFAQAFETLVRRILSKNELEVGRWRDAIRDAVGLNGQLVVNLIPELELIIGKQAPVPELPPQEAQNRFQAVLRAFLGVFARKEHPLALFLDDLQWQDAATLQLLEHLVTHPDVRHLLLIGAYRDNEVSPSHPLMLRLDSIRKTETIVRDIVLAPLSLDDVSRLITDSLHQDRTRTKPLAWLVHEKTAGNPFFAIQFLTALSEENLLEFDRRKATWRWDVSCIQARRITDNVVDFVVGKLNRLPFNAREALKRLACLGNSAKADDLTMVHGSEEEVQSDLWEAVRGGFVLRLGGSYKFLHDRIQEAAYALIPEEQHAEVHLRIGRLLIAKMNSDEITERIFDIVNQLNLGATLISDQDEKDRVAELNLCAGRKAKTSTAYASACIYLSAGIDLVGGSVWERRYELALDLLLERAECEYLNGNFEKAEELISELLYRAASKVDKAAAYRLKILLHLMRAEYRQAVDSGLECLRLFGIEMPAHPTRKEVRVEYKKVWQNLGKRSIESLIDLPLMTDPEKQAAMRVPSEIRAPALNTDSNLFYLLLCHIANASLKYGTTHASAHGYAELGCILGPVFHRYMDGYRFGKLACSLVEKYGLNAYKGRAYFNMEMAVLWIQPIRTAIDFIRLAFRTSIEAHDLSYACFSCNHLVTDLLMQGVHLDEVWCESQKGLEFVHKVKFRDAAEIIVSQQRFIQSMRGQTAAFSSFSDAQFDEETFEAQLTEDRMTTMVCLYWILKLQARFMSGDYDAASAAARKAKGLLWTSETFIQSVNYHYYSALTIAALHETAGPERQDEGLEVLKQSLEQLREWAESCRETFLDKYSLVSAEVARIEGRDLEAMRLYEEAIRIARENGFVQNEGIGNELAGQFYLKRGLEKVAHTYLRDARYCYLSWGALGKVNQLDQLYPGLEEQASLGSTTTMGAPIEQLDLVTVVKALQAVSREIDLGKLIETLMIIAVEYAGAERGLLFLSRGQEHEIEAEATTQDDNVQVILRQAFMTLPKFPESILRYVIRTRQSVILEDASAESPFSDDDYVRVRCLRSILCLPLVKLGALIGVLYLENNLTPRVFTPDRLAVLELLASQAAISLENARLYADLRQENCDRSKAEEALRASEERMSLAAEAANLGMWVWDVARDEVWMTEKGRALFGIGPDTRLDNAALISGVHPEDRATRAAAIKRAIETQGEYAMEYRVLLPDGTLRWIGARGHCIHVGEPKEIRLLGVSMDVSAQKLAQDALRESEARFRAMANTAPVMIWMSGTDKLCTFFNKGWFAFTGRSLEQELGNGWAEGVHREDFDRCFEVYANSFDARQPFTMEYRLRRSDGEYRWVLDNGAPRLASDGTFLGYIGSCIDITERKQAQDRFELVVEASPNGIVLVNAQSHIVLVNASAEKLLGYERQELIGQGVELLVPERFRGEHPAYRAAFHAAPAGRAMGAGLELFARRKDGTEFPVEIGSNLIESPEGTLILSVMVDISARKQAEAQTRQHREELAHLSRVAIMGEIAGSLAHELNQPLTGIVNNASAGRRFIARGRADLPKLDSLFEGVVADGRRAGEIIRGIRSMVRKGEEVRTPVNLNDVIASVLGFVHSDALGHQCALITETDPKLPLVEADQVQLQQVLLNLVVNALEAMRERPAAERRMIIHSERESDGRVRLSVRDFGIGLPAEEPKQIFDRFFSTKREGMGLGLAIARSIITLHGGELAATNAQGGGACVYFSLPIIAEGQEGQRESWQSKEGREA
jgi:PAS domain S-box-containing protein